MHVVRFRPVSDRERIIAGCIASCYYDSGIHRDEMGRGVYEMRNKELGRIDLVNVNTGLVTPVAREGRMIGRSFA